MSDKYASEYPLPGGVDQYFGTLIALLRYVGDGPVSHDAVMQFVFQTYPHTKGSTAVGIYLGYISRMGLWSVKDDQVRLTVEGSDLVKAADSDSSAAKRAVLDIKRKLIMGYDDILASLSGKPLTFDEMDSQLKAALKVDWQSKNQTSFRVNWLRSLGFVEKNGRTYHLTPIGETIAAGLSRGPGGKTKEPSSRDSPVTPLVQKAINLANRIDQAAVMGLTGAELENLTGEAFVFLGFDTQVISGSGNPDVAVTAHMGKRTYRALVDTKSRSSGVVQQNDVNFSALKEHKVKANADYTVVLGADFAGGNLEKWAHEHQVRLLRTEELKQLLLAHAEGVIALDRLEVIFRGGGTTDEAVLSEILVEAEHTTQTMSLARLVYDAVRTHQDQEGALNAHSLYYILGGEYSIEAIQSTVDLLESDLIGAIGRTDSPSFYTRLTPQMLEAKLTQLQEALSGFNPEHS